MKTFNEFNKEIIRENVGARNSPETLKQSMDRQDRGKQWHKENDKHAIHTFSGPKGKYAVHPGTRPGKQFLLHTHNPDGSSNFQRHGFHVTHSSPKTVAKHVARLSKTGKTR